MMRRRHGGLEVTYFAALVLTTGLSATAVLRGAEPALVEQYGFLPLEIVKLADRSSNLLSGDFNKDGLLDLVLIDNSHHRLDLLLQRSQPVAAVETQGRRDVNRLDDAWRFEHKKLAVDQDVAAVAVGDFNHDGRTDLAYFGLPDQLILKYQPEQGEWQTSQQLRVADVSAGSWCVTAGDLNHDQRDDLVLLGKSETYVLLQQPEGGFGPITRLMNTSEKLGLAQIADLNGDGRSDLCYLAGEGSSRGLGLRLQDERGQLGPEYLFDLERPRAVSIRDVDGKPGQEILTIDSRTGRIKILRLVMKTYGPQEVRERLVRYGFGRNGGRDRDWALADFDADGKVDVVVSDPGAARILTFRQTADRGLDLGTPYPSVGGADILRAGRLRNDAGPELVLRSTAEKSIGVATWKEGRFHFPESLPLDQEPAGMELMDLNHDGQQEIVALVRNKDGRESTYALLLYGRTTDGQLERLPYGDEKGIPVALKSTPERSLVADVWGDAQPELLFLQGNKPPVVLQWTADKQIQEVVTTGSVSSGTIAGRAAFPVRWDDHPGLLVAQENFARHLFLSPQKRWQVGEQINSNESAARLAGAALVDLDGDRELEAVLIDPGVKKLRLLRRQNGVFQPWRELDLGEMEYLNCQVADLNSDGRQDLALFAADQLAVLYAGGTAPALVEVASFETALEKTFPTDVVAGDLNGDGMIDLAVTDTRSHFLEILKYTAPGSLDHALYFKIFEEKTFQNDEGPGAEPREALIADVTGDGRADLILLAHDRLLIYPQDAGTPAAPSKKVQ